MVERNTYEGGPSSQTAQRHSHSHPGARPHYGLLQPGHLELRPPKESDYKLLESLLCRVLELTNRHSELRPQKLWTIS